MAELIYYKRNVNYVVGGRFFLGDWQGWTLTNENPYVAVDKEKLRDFKIANKRAIIEGLIVESTEPSIDWETPNAVTDEKASELIKNYFALKNELPKIDSLSTLYKILEAAKDQNRPKKTITLIENRVEEVGGETEEVTLADMRGVS